MSSLTQTEARAALHALFEPRSFVAYAEPEIEIEPPHNLDAAISADAAMSWEVESYRWYRGTDAKGVNRVFRFRRGRPVDEWQAHLKAQRLTSVNGPFRTQQHANLS